MNIIARTACLTLISIGLEAMIQADIHVKDMSNFLDNIVWIIGVVILFIGLQGLIDVMKGER